VFTTDGRIPGLKLVALPDDKNFFPIYNASNTIRGDVAAKSPGVVQVSNEIAKRLDYNTMLGLNGQISSQGQDPAAVAHTWLQQQGLIGQS
jgi:osmoprotectant transport system substrate-binding protein